jgi:hypothetical protein
MLRQFGLFAVAVVGFALVACQTIPYQGVARDVKVKPQTGGVIAVPTNPRVEDRTKAEQRMTSVCAPNPYKVLEEGEVVTGTVTHTNGSDTKRDDNRQTTNLWGMNFVSGQAAGTETSSHATTSATKEWQISYECSVPAPTKKR